MVLSIGLHDHLLVVTNKLVAIGYDGVGGASLSLSGPGSIVLGRPAPVSTVEGIPSLFITRWRCPNSLYLVCSL